MFLSMTGWFVWQMRIEKQLNTIERLQHTISSLKAETILFFYKPLESEEGFVRGTLTFVLSDKSTNQITLQMNGEVLFFDIYVIRIEGNSLFFPVNVYTNSVAPSEGVKLVDLYDQNGVPSFYKSYGLDGIKQLYADIKNKPMRDIESAYGSSVHLLNEGWSAPKPGHTYKITGRKMGGVEIMEE